jgi:hypothetical protein
MTVIDFVEATRLNATWHVARRCGLLAPGEAAPVGMHPFYQERDDMLLVDGESTNAVQTLVFRNAAGWVVALAQGPVDAACDLAVGGYLWHEAGCPQRFAWLVQGTGDAEGYDLAQFPGGNVRATPTWERLVLAQVQTLLGKPPHAFVPDEARAALAWVWATRRPTVPALQRRVRDVLALDGEECDGPETAA